MRRKIAAAILALALFVPSVGCFSFVDWTHNKRHVDNWGNQLRSMHKSFDLFFMDYDWEEPNIEQYQ